MINDSSLYRLISIGTAATNKALNEDIIEVWPTEHLSYVDGEITNALVKLEAKGEDAQGQKYESFVMVSATLRAKWKPNGTNRTTPPDIRRGEKVEIWRYADTDKYYWSVMGSDDEKRKLETVVHSYSGTQDEEEKDVNPENSYQTEVSTHKKLMRITTSKKNGEKVGYTVLLDGGNGLFGIADDMGNFIQMDSEAEELTMQNKTGTFINMIKDTINVNATKDLNIEAGGNINIKAGGKVVINAGGSYELSTPTYTAKTTSYNINTSSLGMSFSSGNMGGGGSATMGGTWNFGDSISHKGKSIGIDHKHTEQGDGRPTSGVT